MRDQMTLGHSFALGPVVVVSLLGADLLLSTPLPAIVGAALTLSCPF